ncbi:unnamed protein product [Lactuca saligna]|uniref:Syntaxin N-terminal domain-containing protein n=1 Tax=Lactuca saligna TaxID=75948 RepID=A0AA36EMR5_LACSI|nr:unnamed protein product [Lactuca saligna]
MNDLLSESFENPRGQDYGHGDLEMGTQNNSNSAELGLDDFFKKVQSIEKQYEKLNKLLKKLQDAHEESKAVTKAAAMKAIKQRMEKDVDEVGKIGRFIKSKIEELDKENLANRQKPGCGKGTGVDRSRTATTLSLKKKFKDKMSEFQALRENIHQEHREIKKKCKKDTQQTQIESEDESFEIKVLFFARAGDLTGMTDMKMEVTSGTDVGDCLDKRIAKFPGLKELRRCMVLALNEEYTTD